MGQRKVVQKIGRKPPPKKEARPSVLIGALAFLDDEKDRDLIEYWRKIPKGEGGKKVREAIRAHMKGGEGEAQKLKRLEGEVARLAGLVEKLTAMIGAGVVVKTGEVVVPAGERLTDAEIEAKKKKMVQRKW